MSKQFSLPGFAMPEPDPYAVFVTLLLPPKTGEEATDLLTQAETKHEIEGRRRPLNHLHVTLVEIGHYAKVPARTVEAVAQACDVATSGTSPFEVRLNRLVSYRNPPGNQPLVFDSKEVANANLDKFRQLLLSELVKSGQRWEKEIKSPHVTMLYGTHDIEEELAEPVTWKATEVVLISSDQGNTKYDLLGRWALRSPA